MSLIDFSLGDIGDLFRGVREAVTGEKIDDPAKQAEILYQLRLMEQELVRGQHSINEMEATHKSIFVAGWRPFIGWIGGLALGYNYILQPIIYTILSANSIEVDMPVLDTSTLMTLVMGMLGFGAMRSFDKKNGVGSGV